MPPQPADGAAALGLGETRSSRRWAAMPGSWDTVNIRALYASSNEHGIPDLPAATRDAARLVAYNDRWACREPRHGDCVHWFLDDYRFEAAWSKPERPLERLARVGLALTPDFSLWAEMPRAVQLWQVYRSRWLGAWWLSHGIDVIPTVSWSTSASYDFAFAGITPGSVVALSAVGVRDPQARALFTAGYAQMLRQLRPATVLFYGPVPSWLDPVAEAREYPTRWEGRRWADGAPAAPKAADPKPRPGHSPESAASSPATSPA